jgi:RHH-type transcriptional regulator, rel operon repressor / antitoxin RelB
MLAIRLDADLEARLTAIAKRTGRTKTFYARQAIIDKIDELEDIALLEEALRDPDSGKTITLAEMRAELGLDA